MPLLKPEFFKKTVAFVLGTLSFVWKERIENGQEGVFKDINDG